MGRLCDEPLIEFAINYADIAYQTFERDRPSYEVLERWQVGMTVADDVRQLERLRSRDFSMFHFRGPEWKGLIEPFYRSISQVNLDS